jgi:hypothetical protein
MVSGATPTAPRTAAFRQTPSTATLPTSRRRGSVISPEETQTSVSSITAPDMSLFISTEGHETTVLNCVKKHLFPRCKFITSNTDLDYDSKEGICSFMLVHCGVKHNSRDWWKHYKLKVKKTLADHRNNRIKSMQQIFIGKYSWLACVSDNNNINTNACSFSAETNKYIHINQQQEEEHDPEAPDMREMVKVRRTDDPAANFPNTDINRADSYKKLLYTFGPAVVGKTKWACTDGVSLLSSVMTVTDEAFIILTIRNYAARWGVMAERCRWKQPMVR